MPMKCILILLITLTFQLEGVAGQLTGFVQTASGVHVSGVTVEGWKETQRVAAVLSDSTGAFVFPEAVAANIHRLRASGLGFEVTEIVVDDPSGKFIIVMTEDPLVIDGLVVVTNQNMCEFPQGDVRARFLWEQASGKYHGIMDTLGVASYLAEADTVISISELGNLVLPDLNLNQRGSSSLLRFSWTRRISRQGYAFSTRATDGIEVYESWVYPPLEADFAPHFIDDMFGEKHYIRILEEKPEGWRLSFCPKSDNDPSISGSMVLAPDTTVVAIRWSFKTPEPLENSGGSAFFPPVLLDRESSYLLPREAITWKILPSGDYLQKYQRYEQWHVAPGDSVPLLPLRHEPGGRPEK